MSALELFGIGALCGAIIASGLGYTLSSLRIAQLQRQMRADNAADAARAIQIERVRLTHGGGNSWGEYLVKLYPDDEISIGLQWADGTEAARTAVAHEPRIWLRRSEAAGLADALRRLAGDNPPSHEASARLILEALRRGAGSVDYATIDQFALVVAKLGAPAEVRTAARIFQEVASALLDRLEACGEGSV